MALSTIVACGNGIDANAVEAYNTCNGKHEISGSMGWGAVTSSLNATTADGDVKFIKFTTNQFDGDIPAERLRCRHDTWPVTSHPLLCRRG